MFVAKSENTKIQPLSFFCYANERFVVGPFLSR